MKIKFIIKYRNYNAYDIGVDERIEKIFEGNRKEALQKCKDYFRGLGHQVHGIWSKYGQKNLI